MTKQRMTITLEGDSEYFDPTIPLNCLFDLRGSGDEVLVQVIDVVVEDIEDNAPRE